MAVQTRAQLDAKSNTVKNETVTGANTAVRVGGLFEDFADSVTLNSERGLAVNYIDSNTSWTPTQGTPAKVTASTKAGVVVSGLFTRENSQITYIGESGTLIKVSAFMTISQGNNNELAIYIAKNNNVVLESMAGVTMSHSNGHAIYVEAYFNANKDDVFSLFINAISDSTAITFYSLIFSVKTI